MSSDFQTNPTSANELANCLLAHLRVDLEIAPAHNVRDNNALMVQLLKSSSAQTIVDALRHIQHTSFQIGSYSSDAYRMIMDYVLFDYQLTTDRNLTRIMEGRPQQTIDETNLSQCIKVLGWLYQKMEASNIVVNYANPHQYKQNIYKMGNALIEGKRYEALRTYSNSFPVRLYGLQQAHHCVYANDAVALQILFDAGVDPRWQKSDLLLNAIDQGHVDMVRYLLPLSQPKKDDSKALVKAALACAIHEYSLEATVADKRDKRMSLLNAFSLATDEQIQQKIHHAQKKYVHCEEIFNLLVSHCSVMDALQSCLGEGMIATACRSVLGKKISANDFKKIQKNPKLCVYLKEPVIQNRLLQVSVSDQGSKRNKKKM